ncbi:MAG: DNA repair protein RecN [Erysipelotrichaceae bacterium]|nr:DNA repair protein RecN [Erysipelotrichaceae bacterium]
MLKSLHIKNYAIIDELSVDFNSGFNVFTGETGAGKSIIVGALSFLMKGKADTGVIRSGQEKAMIEGIFSIDEDMKAKLDEAEIDYDDELIVRRIISTDNHNSIKINQSSVTLSFLTDLFADHIDIHSQKDSQYLLNKANHLKLLDKYLNDPELLDQYEQEFKNYTQALGEYEELANNTYNEADLDYLKFDLKEIEDADIRQDEEEELQEKERRYKDAEKYLSVLNEAKEIYDGQEGIKERLSYLYKNLTLNDQAIEMIRDRIEELYFSLDEEMDKLKDILSGFNEEDLDIDYIEDRLFIYSRLKRKHNTDVSGLLALKEQIKEKIAFFEDRDFVLGEKKKQVDALYNKAYETALRIHEIRREKALLLEKEVVDQCLDLMLNNVNFKVQFTENKLSRNGIDDVEFYISLNKGEELKPLKNVASGGEISRLMLSLKSVFTSLSDTSLIIFDEIDTGVSGKVGLAIGQKMAHIAKNAQVLTITHLASVAACADYHFYIYKEDNSEYSRTLIRRLDEDEIIKELAMISSTDTSEVSLDAARALYYNARESLK